ncbi:hypothetical protein D9M68_864770 [compost metagenome]
MLAGISEMLTHEGKLTMHLSESLDNDDKIDVDEMAKFEAYAERLVQAVFKLGATVRKKHAEDCAHG